MVGSDRPRSIKFGRCVVERGPTHTSCDFQMRIRAVHLPRPAQSETQKIAFAHPNGKLLRIAIFCDHPWLARYWLRPGVERGIIVHRQNFLRNKFPMPSVTSTRSSRPAGG